MPPPIEYCPSGGEPYNGGGIVLLCGLPLVAMAAAPLLPLLPLGLRLKGDIFSERRAGWGSISNNIVRQGWALCFRTLCTVTVSNTLHCSTNTVDVSNPLTH